MDPILQNHLLFMRRHRGDYAVTETAIYIASEAPGFTSWVPLSRKAHLPADLSAVRLMPWSGDNWSRELEEAGYRLTEQLSYQDLDLRQAVRNWGEQSDLSIVRGQTDQDALAFAEVQSAGFLEHNGDTGDWWRSFFRFVALRNIRDSTQDFLIAVHDGEPVAVLLVVTEADIAGIYAVATRPQFRNRGFSGALLREAAAKARERGASKLVLQAMCGTYADGFYKRLGFSERYISDVWRKQA